MRAARFLQRNSRKAAITLQRELGNIRREMHHVHSGPVTSQETSFSERSQLRPACYLPSTQPWYLHYLSAHCSDGLEVNRGLANVLHAGHAISREESQRHTMSAQTEHPHITRARDVKRQCPRIPAPQAARFFLEVGKGVNLAF